MSAHDLYADDFPPHGTTLGYAAGCHSNGACPGRAERGQTRWCAAMSTPASEYLRTLTNGGNVSLLQQPRRGVSAADLRAAEDMVPEVLFRMFQPHEVAAGMAFPADYVWQPVDRLKPVSNRDLVKAAGNAVTPPAARDIGMIAVDSIGDAA